MEKYISFIVLLFLLSSCSNTEDSSTYIYHPTEENLKRDVTFVLSNKNTQKQAEIGQIRDKLEKRKFLTSIGNLFGNEPEIFSDIFQVEITDSEILIFERGNFRISRFDFQGNFISNIEATGRGPNELQQPLKISISNDTLYVMDGFDVKFLDLTQSDPIVETLYSSENAVIEDLCSLNDKFLLRYYSTEVASVNDSSAILHVVDKESDEIKTSFGEPYKANSPTWSRILSEGRVICNDETNTVVSITNILPYIVAHNNQGVIKWVVEAENFKPIIHRQHNVPEGSLNFRWNEEPFTHTSYTQLLNLHEFVLLQVTTFENFLNDNDRFQNDKLKTDTYLIHSKTGESEYLGSDIPKILAINDNYLIFEKEEEFPAIEVFEI